MIIEAAVHGAHAFDDDFGALPSEIGHGIEYPEPVEHQLQCSVKYRQY